MKEKVSNPSQAEGQLGAMEASVRERYSKLKRKTTTTMVQKGKKKENVKRTRKARNEK